MNALPPSALLPTEIPETAHVGFVSRERNVVRQVYAGLLWSKQFYHYIVHAHFFNSVMVPVCQFAIPTCAGANCSETPCAWCWACRFLLPAALGGWGYSLGRRSHHRPLRFVN